MPTNVLVVPEAVKLDEIGYEEMHEYAAAGAGVLQPVSVDFGRRYGIPMHVRSSLHDGSGTWVKPDAASTDVVGGAHGDAAVSVVGHRPDKATRMYEVLADVGIEAVGLDERGLRASATVGRANTEKAVIALHDGFLGGGA